MFGRYEEMTLFGFYCDGVCRLENESVEMCGKRTTKGEEGTLAMNEHDKIKTTFVL